MSASSGQAVTERAEWRECPRCYWEGVVDVWFDPELHAVGWTCSGCSYDYESDVTR